MKFEYIKVYNWSDLQAEICNRMGINESSFRYYHSVVAGDYKDLWHVALESIVPDNMSNGSIVTMFSSVAFDSCESWEVPFFNAWNNIMDELDPDENGILVRFFW